MIAVGFLYRHQARGTICVVTGFCRRSEDEVEMVLYRYVNSPQSSDWVMPMSGFCDPEGDFKLVTPQKSKGTKFALRTTS